MTEPITATPPRRRWSRFELLLVLASPFLLCTGAVPVLPASAAPIDSGLSKVLIDGMVSSRRELKRGIFRAKGETQLERLSVGKQVFPVAIYCAFDDDSRLLRFDRRYSAPTSSPGSPENVLSQFCRNAAWSAHFSNRFGKSATMVQIHPVEGSHLPPGESPFDVRCVGLYYWRSFGLGHALDTVIEGYRKVDVQDIVDEGRGIYRLVWPTSHIGIRRTLWIDKLQGFTPIRLLVESRSRGLEGGKLSPEIESEASWKQISGVWVPTSFQLSRTREPNSDGVALEFEWESVNAPVDSLLFHYDSFDLARGTFITDSRGDAPVVKEIIKANLVTHEAAAPAAVSWLKTGLSMAGLFALLLVIVTMTFRFGQRKPADN